MRIETGIITKIEHGRVLVEAASDEGCDNCATKGTCMVSNNGKKRHIWVDNDIQAKLGDWVSFSIDAKSVVLSSLLIYAAPILLLLTGMITGGAIFGFSKEIYTIIGGCLGLILGFLLIKLLSKTLNKKKIFTPQLVAVIETKKKS